MSESFHENLHDDLRVLIFVAIKLFKVLNPGIERLFTQVYKSKTGLLLSTYQRLCCRKKNNDQITTCNILSFLTLFMDGDISIPVKRQKHFYASVT